MAWLTAGLALVLAFAADAPAHVVTTAGSFRVRMGWLREPAFTGTENAAQVDVSDLSGAPISRGGAVLTVQVMYGSAVVTLPLLPVQRPGEFQAVLIPTQAGRYTFRVSGTIRNQPIGAESTCSSSTFNCVSPASQIEFPAAGQSNTQLVQGLVRALGRAHSAEDAADTARAIAIVALAITAVAAAIAIVLSTRWKRRPQ
jgi:hypothetical protein